jgi:acyl dehydratase
LPVVSRARAYTRNDARLYALSVGFGSDPLDEQELDFVAERPAFRPVPSMATIFAGVIGDLTTHCELARPELAVHAEQRLECCAPLPDEGALDIKGAITGVFDRGADRGAELHMVATARLRGHSEPLYRATYVTVARGDGGFGGPAPVHSTTDPIPLSEPTAIIETRVLPQQALLYSLNGDPNPIHTDPATARKAGFDAPILHGLCTYGMACRAVLGAHCDYDSSRMKSFDVRFSAPVYPGEALSFETWNTDSGVIFQARAKERDVLILKNGYSRITAN